jgi:peroxiredoxin
MGYLASGRSGPKKVAAVSYKSVGVLGEFAKQKSITFLLLSDRDSVVIRAYAELNALEVLHESK